MVKQEQQVLEMAQEVPDLAHEGRDNEPAPSESASRARILHHLGYQQLEQSPRKSTLPTAVTHTALPLIIMLTTEGIGIVVHRPGDDQQFTSMIGCT
jgi:hypothetical protein